MVVWRSAWTAQENGRLHLEAPRAGEAEAGEGAPRRSREGRGAQGSEVSLLSPNTSEPLGRKIGPGQALSPEDM